MTGKKLDTVYRVVGPDGQGFYFSEGGQLMLRVDEIVGYQTGAGKEQHPMPYDDGIDEIPDDYKFGFQSLHNLKSWFTADIMKAAHEQKCEVQMWEVKTDYKLGRRQMCFDEQKAKLRSSQSIGMFVKHK